MKINRNHVLMCSACNYDLSLPFYIKWYQDYDHQEGYAENLEELNKLLDKLEKCGVDMDDISIIQGQEMASDFIKIRKLECKYEKT